jgi:hypothetical protein
MACMLSSLACLVRLVSEDFDLEGIKSGTEYGEALEFHLGCRDTLMAS